MVNGEGQPVKVPSQAAIARALNMSPANITKLKAQGMPVHSVEAAKNWRLSNQNIAQRKKLPRVWAAPVPGTSANMPSEAPPLDNSPDPDAPLGESHDQARTRREIAEANLAELRLRELRAELLRRDVVERIVSERAARTKESVLQIKARVAPLLAAETDVLKITALLDTELRAALSHGAD